MFSIKEALSFGWHKVKNNFWPIILIMIVTAIPTMAGQILSRIMESTDSTILLIVGFVLSLAVYVLSFIVGIGFMKLMLRVYDGEMPQPKEVFSAYGVFWKYVGVNIIYGLIVFGGFILLIVPGIIWAIKYSFAPLIVIDKKIRPMEAIRESAKLTQGVKLKLLGFGIVSGLIAVVGYLALFVGALVSIPISVLAFVYVYRTLEKRLAPTTDKSLTTNTASV